MSARNSVVALAVAVAACSGARKTDTTASTGSAPAAEQPVEASPPPLSAEQERAHHVSFADRTSYAYLLLLPDQETPPTPAREELAALVETEFADRRGEEEVSLLVDMIKTDPETTRHPMNVVDPNRALGQTNEDMEAFANAQTQDLLGLYVEVMRNDAEPSRPLIRPRSFADPVLTRALTPQERDSLPERPNLLLLRAEYRNKNGVRGLRLLQTLVELVARRRGALIHDWDLGETMNVDAFAKRKLQAGLGNVADQIAVVPFPDPRHGKGAIRLTTRGMRRFGSPELELDGLPTDVEVLQAATHMLYGLVFRVARDSEVHESGLAMEAPEEFVVHYRDIEQAYAGRGASVARCKDCEEQTTVHLVIRPEEDTDPRGHPVARIVAPREQSDATGYDHRAWVQGALGEILGELNSGSPM